MVHDGAAMVVASGSASRWVALFALTATCACSSTEDETGATSGNGSRDAGRPDAHVFTGEPPPFDAAIFGDGAPWEDPSRVSLTQQVQGWGYDPSRDELGPTGETLEGVEVCLVGFEESVLPCVHTDADGVYTLEGLPARSDLQITLKKEGFVPALQPWMSENDDADLFHKSPPQGHIFLFSEDTVASLQPPGVEWNRNLGVIFVAAWDGAIKLMSGVTATHVAPAADAPTLVYYDEQRKPDPTATSTTGGTLAFWNAAATLHAIQLEHPAFHCELAGRYGPDLLVGGSPGTETGQIVLPAAAGQFTLWGGAWCATPK